ncbi:MAG: hypothetical protein AAGB22_00925 [Bacteroidota bacterium]
MTDTKTILFLTTQLPYPPVSGGVIKSWKLVEHLASQHRLRVIAMLKGQDAEHEGAFQEAVALDRYHGAALDVPRTGLNWLKSLLLSDCLNAYRNRLPALQARVDEWAQDADMIFVDHYEMFQYVPKHFTGKVVFHEHNAEYVMWQRFSALETRPLHKAILAIEARRIRKAEARYANRADLTLAAPNDIEALAPHCQPGTRFEVTYHLGDDTLLDRPPVAFSQTTESLLLVGTPYLGS